MIQINQIEKKKSVIQARKYLILVDLQLQSYEAKITKIESKKPSITGLATSSALIGVKNEIPDASNLVKKNRL